MKLLDHPVFLLMLAAGAGMAAQEFVTEKLCAANDQAEAVSVESLTTWGTARAYYTEGRMPRGVFRRAEALVAVADPLPDQAAGNGLHPDGTFVASRILQEELETRPTIIAQRQTGVLAQTPTPPPAATTKPPKATASEPDADTFHILPPPAKRVPSEHTVEDEPVRADYARTPSNIAPPFGHPYVPPTLTGVSPTESKQYVDPQELVRQRAARKAEERRRRIEARKWLGYSPLRPPVSAVPIMGGGSPHPTVILVPYVVDDRK